MLYIDTTFLPLNNESLKNYNVTQWYFSPTLISSSSISKPSQLRTKFILSGNVTVKEWQCHRIIQSQNYFVRQWHNPTILLPCNDTVTQWHYHIIVPLYKDTVTQWP